MSNLQKYFPVFPKDDLIKPIIGLIVNLFFPGFGTIVCSFLPPGGTHKQTLIIGIIQVVMTYGCFVAGALLSWTIVGMTLYFGYPLGWLWALIWSIMMCYYTSTSPVPQQAVPVIQVAQTAYYGAYEQVPNQPVGYYQPPQAQFYPPQDGQQPMPSSAQPTMEQPAPMPQAQDQQPPQ